MRFLGLFALLLPVSLSAQSSSAPVPQISIRSITIQCAAPELAKQVGDKTLEAVKQQTYSTDSLQQISQRIRHGFQSRGYFKALVSEPSIAGVTPTSGNQQVDITVCVKEGERYRLEALAFEGNSAIASDELRAQFNLSPGDVFDTDKVRQGLELVRKLYANKGYVRFTPIPSTQVDDKKHTVSLYIQIEEGNREGS